jgi:hypothetical protein
MGSIEDLQHQSHIPRVARRSRPIRHPRELVTLMVVRPLSRTEHLLRLNLLGRVRDAGGCLLRISPCHQISTRARSRPWETSVLDPSRLLWLDFTGATNTTVDHVLGCTDMTNPVFQDPSVCPEKHDREAFEPDTGQRSRAIIPGDDPGDQQLPGSTRSRLRPGSISQAHPPPTYVPSEA